MIYIGDHLAFWTFASIEVGFLAIAIIIARLIGAKKPNQTKRNIYECGQQPFGDAWDFKILGITRYFGYAVIFFALDAFAWVVLTAAMSVNITFEAVAIVSIYILIVLVGVGYFLAELGKLVS